MKRLVLALLLTFLMSMTAHADPYTIGPSFGGKIGEFEDLYRSLNASGADVRVTDVCLSACTLVTAYIPPERICVTERAVFGFHAAWNFGSDGRPVQDDEATGYMLGLYPPRIRALLRHQKRLTVGHMIRIRGTSLGYRLCDTRESFARD